MTIHNINESKFLGNQQQQAPISNHVEITRIPAEKANCDKLAVGSERRNLQQATTETGMSNGCEFWGIFFIYIYYIVPSDAD